MDSATVIVVRYHLFACDAREQDIVGAARLLAEGMLGIVAVQSFAGSVLNSLLVEIVQEVLSLSCCSLDDLACLSGISAEMLSGMLSGSLVVELNAFARLSQIYIMLFYDQNGFKIEHSARVL